MKKYIYLIALIFISPLQNLYCQAADSVLIKTPFCHQPEDYKLIENESWDQYEIENCKQVFLYSGGLFKMVVENGNISFEEKTNYLHNYEVFCMDFDGDDSNNVYIGANTGIYKSTDSGDNWIKEEDYHELDERIVYCLSINDKTDTTLSFAGTDNGIWKSTDNDSSWVQSLSGKTIKSILLVDTYYYIAVSAGTDPGVWRSTNNGADWSRTLYIATNTLYFNNDDNINRIYAGTDEGGLYYSTNNGLNWSPIAGSYSWDIRSILTNDLDIYIGTKFKGFLFYDESVPQWYAINLGYPGTSPNELATLHSMLIFDGDIYAATGDDGIHRKGDGLYKISFPPTTYSRWDKKEVKDDLAIYEKDVRMLYLNDNDLWVVCNGGALYPSARVIENAPPDPTNPSNWPNFNCHGYAWHFKEGGITGCGGFVAPETTGYIIKENEDINNWDYIKATNDDKTNGSWDKVTYEGDHSGINSYLSPYPDPFIENDIRVISKWGPYGPLIEHYINDHPYSGDIKFWKSKKVVSGAIDEDQFIGRQIITDESTTISAGEAVDFYVAPMYNHMIKMTDGFHAPASCAFHAYVKDDCTIPWEEYRSSGKISANKYDNEDITDLFRNKTDDKANLKLIIFPNPSSQMISIIAKVSGNGGQCPINIKFYTFSGEIVKAAAVLNGIETGVSVEDMVSGAYLVAARADYVDEQGEAVNLSASEIIVIEK